MAQLVLLSAQSESADSKVAESADSQGQLVLFTLPPEKPSLAVVDGMASSNVGEAGESMFEGFCRSWHLPFYRAGRGQIGPDYYVNECRLNVKATHLIRPDGRMWFQAGSGKKFSDYEGLIDMFVFVYVGLEPDHFGRSLLVPIGPALQRWRSRVARIRPIELPRTPNLERLVTFPASRR